MAKQATATFLIVKVCIIAALAGLLFGLDVAYVNGSLGFIIRDFHLNVAQSGMVAGYLLAGAAVGALFSGWLCHTFGRKKILVLAALIFTVVTLLSAAATNFYFFLAARFVAGIAVGIASFVAPLYLSEIAPFKYRGALIAMYQLMVTIGILLMFLSNAALMHTGSWRIMILVLVVPSLIMLVGAITLPESPRWKVLIGKADDARQILSKIRNNQGEVDFELNEIKATVKSKSTVLHLFKESYFYKIVILGVALQAVQQFCGMNAFMYYSEQIFVTAGFNDPETATVVVGLVNVLATVLSVQLVDKLGRKPILYFGCIFLVIACFIVGYLFNLQSHGMVLNKNMQYLLLAACLVFIFSFAISLGGIIWILCAEIFPLDARDLGMTITTMANWTFNAVIGSYTLTWFSVLGVGHTFWLFGIVSFIGIFIIKFFTPETKNIPLEELGANLKSGQPLRLAGHRSEIQ